MKKEIENTNVFYAEDGTRFLAENECVAYEKEKQKEINRLKCVKFFQVIHSPDLTEGRGWYGRLFIAAEDSYAAGNQETYAAAAATTLYGNPLAFVQGVAEIPNWRICASSFGEFKDWKDKNIKVGDYSYSASAIFISSKGEIAGWPSPVPISDLLDKKKVEKHIIGGKK